MRRHPRDLPIDASARPASDKPTDGELWAALRQGDAAAFEQLFHRHGESLCDFAFSYVDDVDAAEDIVHSLFVALWHGRADLATPRSVRAYLLTAVRNRAISHRRSERVRLLSLERLAAQSVHSDSAGDPGESDDRVELLRAAIARLPRRCREVVMLVRFNRLTHAEAGAVLGIASKTVEVHLGRAIRILREALTRRD